MPIAIGITIARTTKPMIILAQICLCACSMTKALTDANDNPKARKIDMAQTNGITVIHGYGNGWPTG